MVSSSPLLRSVTEISFIADLQIIDTTAYTVTGLLILLLDCLYCYWTAYTVTALLIILLLDCLYCYWTAYTVTGPTVTVSVTLYDCLLLHVKLLYRHSLHDDVRMKCTLSRSHIHEHILSFSIIVW